MAATPKIDELTEDELTEYLNNNSEEDLKADETEQDEDVDSNDAVVFKDEEETFKLNQDDAVKSGFDSLTKSPKQMDKEYHRVQKEREKLIKKHRKALKKNPSRLVRYNTNPSTGLPRDIVDARIIDGLVNETNNKSSKSIPKIIFSNLITVFNILIFFIAACLIAVGAYTDLVFLLIVTCNIIIGIVQEIRAKNMIDKLSLMSAPTAIVRRDSKNMEIGVNEVVLDDLLLLENGRQICADSIVVDGSVEVNESLLTGESDAIIKNVGDVLYSGSFVVSGRCSARVDKVGKDNYIEQLSNQAKQYKKPKSDLLFSLNFIIKFMLIPILLLGGGLFFIMYFNNYIDLTTSVRKTAGAMIGMIPSGLFLMSSIALMVGVIRLSQKNVLVQELYCIEMLARVNCICLDKTGTITDGTMVVRNVVDYNTVYGLATKNIVSAMLNALQDNNLTSQALKDKFGLGKRIKHIAAIPFSSQRKYQAVTFDKYGTFILGAPEFVLKDDFERYKNDVNKYAALGYRVLSLVHKDGKITDGKLPDVQNQMVSMILIEDNIRPDAINTIKYFRESGVQVKVISGDNPITVSKISQRAGIENATEYISLDGLSDSEVVKAASKYTVFGRVSPTQKRLLIQTLKDEGLTVAMTGDGVNDILALKEADCSIAVASGSEAARNCSHLVLVDSNFDSMPSVVAEGRRVINNVTTVSALFLTKTMFSLFLAIQAFMQGAYPISTNQLIIIDTLAIGLPSLLLVQEPNNDPVKGRFLFNVLKEALPGALTILLISLFVFGLRNQLVLSSTELSTIIVIAATHTCMMVLIKACKPFNTMRKVLCTFCYSMFLLIITFVPQFLELHPIIGASEYYSDSIQIQTLTSYPMVERSKDNFYVVDGKVISLQTNNNYKNINLTAVSGDPLDPNQANNLYYAINGTRIDTLLAIPNISYNDKGDVFFGGYEVTNITYSDTFEENLIIDENGYVKYVTSYNLYTNTKTTQDVKIKLTRDNDYYNFDIKYGVYKEADSVVPFRVMPTVEVKNGEYVINGVQSNEYKYMTPINFSLSGELDVKIGEEKDQSGKVIGYLLLIDDKPIYPTLSDGTVSTEPYRVKLPTVSTNADKRNSSGTIYLDAVNTEYSIFELFGEEIEYTDEETGASYSKYTIKKLNDNNEITLITYDKLTNSIYVDGILTESYRFTDLKTKAFRNYLDKDDNQINVNNSLSITARNGDGVYSIKLDDEYHQLGIIGSIDNSFVAPTIEISVGGNYVINGYYTNIKFSNNELNPHVNSENYLVLGGVVTDYAVSANDILISKGGMVEELKLASKIFLAVLCLISGPVMKLFQNCIPWLSKQFNNIGKFIGKTK